MPELTPTQKAFLDRYIRQHRILGRFKQSQSKKFLHRLGTIAAAIERLPSWEVDAERMAVSNANQKADTGDFIGAYRDLKQTKINIRRRVNRYDPAATFDQLDDDVRQCLAGSAAAVAAVQAAYDDPTIDAPFEGDESAVRDLLAARHPMTDLRNFLDTIVTMGSRIRDRADEMKRFDVNRALAVTASLDNGFMNLTYLPGQDGGIRSFDTIRDETLDACARSWLSRGAKRTPASDAVNPMRELEKAHDQNALRGVQEHAPQNFETIGRFDTKTFLQGLPLGSPEEIATGVTRKLTEMFTSSGTDKDLLFDVQVRQEDELFWDFLRENKLATNRILGMKSKGEVRPEAAAKADAFAKTVMKVAREQNPNTLDFKTGVLTLDDDEYGSPQVLKRGGFGEVRKFADKDDPTKSIVVKTALPPIDSTQDPQKHLLYEARQHHRAMKGPPTEPGRKNILEMKGVVHDETGQVHVVLETADAGNLNDMKETLNLVRDVLPEEARNMMNQFLLKQAIEGVMYLRDRGMIHVDLKEDNVFVMSDGTVKVADLGSAISRSNNDRLSSMESGDLTAGTLGYMAPESMTILRRGGGDVSTKGDTYALGKMSRLMHLGQKSPPEDQDAEKVQGALSRLTEAMTAQDHGQRPTLESVLESSYFQNLEPDRDADVRELTQAVIALGKKRKDLIKSADDPQLSEEVAELNHRVQELSTFATRPSDDFAQQPGKQMGDFIGSLQSAANDASQFCKYLALSSSSRYLKSFGANSYDIKKAVDCWAGNMADPELRKGETALPDRLELAKQAVQKALGKITNKSLRDVLAKGFRKMLAGLREQFVRAHGDDGLANADAWTDDLVDQDAVSSGVNVEAVDDDVFKLATAVDDVIDPAVRRDCAGVLAMPAVPCKITVESSRKSADKKYADAPVGSEQSAAIVLDTVQQRSVATLNQRIAALLADVRQYQTAYNNGVRTAPEMAAVLVEGAANKLAEELARFDKQLEDGIQAAGLFGCKLTGIPFEVKGMPLVTLDERAFPPPRPFAEEYREASLGELSALEAEQRLTGRSPFSWLVRNEADTFVVSSIEPDGDGTKFVHTDVDVEKVGIGVFRTYLGEQVGSEQI